MKKEKKTQVVILETTNGGKIHRNNLNRLYTTKDNYTSVISSDVHLYFLSDDEIKEGDWVCNGEVIFQRSSKINLNIKCKKIIASTDESLGFHQEFIDPKDNRANSRWVTLPRPSNSFIQKYVEEYNKGNIITEVMVEYEQKYETISEGKAGFPEDTIDWWVDKVKIKPDNTIIISTVEETWDDIIKQSPLILNSSNKEEFVKYIKENYQVPKQIK